jgi:hypothetical protein
LLLLLLAAEERGGSRLAQDSYFGGQIAEAKLLNCPHTLRHIWCKAIPMKITPVKQCGCFKNKAACFFSDQLGHAPSNSCKCKRKEFRLARSFPPGKSEFFPEPMSKLVIVEK